MKNNNAPKETAKTQSQTSASAKATADKPAPAQNGKAKAPKAKKEPAAKVEKDEEPADRLPTTVAELKESKSGLVTFLFLSGKDKDTIAIVNGSLVAVDSSEEKKRREAQNDDKHKALMKFMDKVMDTTAPTTSGTVRR